MERHDDSELVRAFCAGRDVACPGCGYNLRDLSGERCPECNERPELSVLGGAPDQRTCNLAQRAVVIAAIGNAAMGVQVAAAARGSGAGLVAAVLWFPVLAFVVAVAGLLLYARRKRTGGGARFIVRFALMYMSVYFAVWLLVGAVGLVSGFRGY